MNGTTVLWAVTTYFNPAGYTRRLQNYRIFRGPLPVPLLAVEWSHNGSFELSQDDADVLVQLRAPDVMWQKERLLNVALRHLPVECTRIAWLDCDILFGNSEWPTLADRALRSHALVQLFDTVHHVSRTTRANPRREGGGRARSVAAAWVRGQVPLDCLRSNTLAGPGLVTGYAWAGRRADLERCKFYDGCIVGGGDKALFAAAVGRQEDIVSYHQMNDSMATHYLRWADTFHGTVGGGVGHIAGDIEHLWHGDLRDRQYTARHGLLSGATFEPARDLRIDDGGCFRWASEKRNLHASVHAYFTTRREDG